MGYIATPAEAFRLMQELEKHGGHPCTKHIGLSNEQLMRRLAAGEGAIEQRYPVYPDIHELKRRSEGSATDAQKHTRGIYHALDVDGKKAGFTRR